MNQKWHQNSRSIMLHDYRTHCIRQFKPLRLLALWNVGESLERSWA
jgi:hypothetical protein